jgi:hypothetical protein
MNRADIIKYLLTLNEGLQQLQVRGEICIYGGTVMCLVFDARPGTKDIDAIFEPPAIIRKIAIQIAKENNLEKDWLNDGVKGFVVKHPKTVLFDYPFLKVYYPEPEYLVAMKALSSRFDSSDKEDIIFLIKKLGINNAEQLFNIIEKYYPRGRIKPVTQFFVEEIFEEIQHEDHI